MQTQFNPRVDTVIDPPREHEAVQTYHCWNCRKRSLVRRTYTFDWVDGRPRRVYEILVFAGTPRCLTCGETLEYLGMIDAEQSIDYCTALCMPAKPHTLNPCHCTTCGGAAHGATYQGA